MVLLYFSFQPLCHCSPRPGGLVEMVKEQSSRVWGLTTTKIGYEAQMDVMLAADLRNDKAWWWHLICEQSSPLKTGIFLCLALSNKVLTWDNGQKSWNGPNRVACTNRIVKQWIIIFSSYPFSSSVWKEFLMLAKRLKHFHLVPRFSAWEFSKMDTGQVILRAQSLTLLRHLGPLVV